MLESNAPTPTVFLSTLSLRRATLFCNKILFLRQNFYPRSPCGERRPCGFCSIYTPLFLSTLSLRRATPGILARQRDAQDFYPRSPCGERLISTKKGQVLSLFLSTLSLRRATYPSDQPVMYWRISIHALLAESDRIDPDQVPGYTISIHALLAESDHR